MNRQLFLRPSYGLIVVLLLVNTQLTAQSTYSTDFEDGTKGSTYTSANDVLNGITWTLSQALIGDDEPQGGIVFDRFNGSQSLRIRYRSSGEQGIFSMNSDVNGIERMSFKYAQFGSDSGAPVIRVEYSTNSGSTWTQAGSDITTLGVTTLTEWSHDLNIAGNVRVRMRAISGTNGRRANIDDLAFTSSAPAAPNSATVAASAFLQGAYNGSSLNTGINGSIPAQQPYNGINLHSETTNVTSMPANAVDWVLVELREAGSAAAALNSTKVGSAAGLLMSDGSIKAMDGTSDLDIALSGNTGADFFVVIYHRNHLPIMSAAAISESSGSYAIDFTSSSANTYQTTTALASLSGSKFGMPAGDIDQDGDIDATDLTTWRTNNGITFSYGSNGAADFNLDGVINALDRNDFHQKNTSKTRQVPNT